MLRNFFKEWLAGIFLKKTIKIVKLKNFEKNSYR